MYFFALILGCMIKADCDIADPPTTHNPGNSALARQGSAEHKAPFANEPKPRPNKGRNREDFQCIPQDGAENRAEYEHRALSVVAPLRATAFLRNIVNERLEESINLSYEEVEFFRPYVGSVAYMQTIRNHCIAVSKIKALELRRRKKLYIFVNKNRVETTAVN